jgi:eukaryotic-like serine/threonine-protein kinase
MNSPFGISKTLWPRASAEFDRLIELNETARSRELVAIRASDTELADALARLLSRVESATSSTPDVTSQHNEASFDRVLQTALLHITKQHKSGERFGAWVLVEQIGYGGMGEVWRAKRSDGLFEGQAAIKLLRSDLAADKLAARFKRERSLLARLNHPNIARMLDAGVADDKAFLVLELVDGKPLLTHVEAHAPSVADRVKIIRDIARAVEHAHAQLVLHRDLKPSNVLITQDGSVKLLDFGVAAVIDDAEEHDGGSKLTQLTGRGLTVEYAAPEQITGELSVAASDVYSLGVMLFHLCTGQRPFADRIGRSAVEYAVVHDEAPRASSTRSLPTQTRGNDPVTSPIDRATLKGDLDAIIAKALRKSPAERYLTASAFARDLDAWLAQTPISVRAEDRSYRSRLWFKRNWKLTTLGAVAATAVVAGLSVSLWQRSEAVVSAAIAKDEAARATKVADYLGELIQSASPDNHGGKWPTVLALLEQSEKDLEQKFKDDPRTHAKLLKQMLDTNDALNRDTVALAQAQRLQVLLDAQQPPNVELQVDNLRQQGWLLYRLRRYEEALALYAALKPKLVAHYGEKSSEHGKLILGIGGVLSEQGRYDEAIANYEQGYALLLQREPDKPMHRLDKANDLTVLYTRQGRWRDAEQALAGAESTFDAVASTGGAELRNVLIMKNNLEAIRLRLGRYEGAETRLQQIADAGTRLLGADNMISLKSADLLVSSACETGDARRCVQRQDARLQSTKKRVGIEPSEIVEAELDNVTTALLFQQAPVPASRDSLRQLITAIATALPKATGQRVYLYRIAADAAIRADDLSLANDAIGKARRDLADPNVNAPDRIAQVERVEAAIAFRSGDPQRAVTLLDARFLRDEKLKETDTPRHATLWLQRALYEIEFDRSAAAKSLSESRAAFARAGVTPPQFKALIAYVEARSEGNTASIRVAQEAVDRAYLRTHERTAKTPWRAPHLSSL